MRSMTGFGAATATRDGISVTVEARSVNNRFLKTTVRTPGALSHREQDLEALVRERAVRGSVTLHLRVEFEEHPVSVRMNEAAVKAYRRLFKKLQKESGLTGEPSIELLAQLPGVFEAEEIETTISREGWELVRETAEKALDRLVRMREREGANLKRDLSRRRTAVAGLVKRIRDRSPKVAKERMARLKERVETLLDRRGSEIQENDLLRELAIIAERSDVTEEVTRLASHLDQYAQALISDQEVGRRLDFLIQEMSREANTIGAKAGDVELAKHCVELKVELDRLKEQVQNVE